MKEKIQKADGVKRILCILLSVGIFAFVLYNIFCYDKESEMYTRCRDIMFRNGEDF